MIKTLVKISVPERLRDGMLMKRANYFEVPASQDGHALMEWWENASSGSRDSVMKLAYARDVDIVEALKEHLDSLE